MGDPLLNLTAEELDRFLLGQVAFDREWIEEEGWGPIFNAFKCSSCHHNPVGGPGIPRVRLGGTLIDGVFDPLEEFGGPLFQGGAISHPECDEVLPGEQMGFVLTFRVPPGMLGYGLVEAIPDDAIIAFEDPDDLDADGISGRVHMVEPLESPGELRVGRFGWKSQAATILTFSAGALLNEIGITNRLVPVENDPNGINPPTIDFCDAVPDPEDNVSFGNGVDREFIDVVTDFQRFLAAPPQTPRSGMTGGTIFEQIGCAACHVSISFTTPDDEALEKAIRGRSVKPYTDFLLHDMGDAADFIAIGDASITELKTPALWGLRTRDPLWHDGRLGVADGVNGCLPPFDDCPPVMPRSEMIDLVIQEHGAAGSEAVASVDAYNLLSAEEQDALMAFLDSLGRIEFDFDGNGVIDLADFQDMYACSMIVGVITPDDPCAVHDVDQDGDVDLDDLDVMLTVYEGLLDDCNNNGVVDLIDVFDGASADCNLNGILDECDIVGDIDGDGIVGTPDLLLMFGRWGDCDDCKGPCGCVADLDGDCVVGPLDLVILLGNWS